MYVRENVSIINPEYQNPSSKKDAVSEAKNQYSNERREGRLTYEKIRVCIEM